jgi:hypothetical protein
MAREMSGKTPQLLESPLFATSSLFELADDARCQGIAGVPTRTLALQSSPKCMLR